MSVPVLVLFGPTASGKTGILLRLFGPGGLSVCGAEVVSADSMQVYRGMDIGTAKPSPEERKKLPHHLIDIRSPDEQFNAGDFVRLAREAVCDIAKRGRLPVVSGGTGFYLKNLIQGLPEAPPSDAAIRTGLKTELREKGAAFLMEELTRVDPESARRIHINDEYRLLRALEVSRLSGLPLSSFKVSGAAPAGKERGGAAPAFADGSGEFRFLVLSLTRPREELYRRINERCTAMFAQGLPDEVRGLYNAGFSPKDPGLRAIGYREFFIENNPGEFNLSQDTAGVQALVAQNSRRYAKRQITFFSQTAGSPLPQIKLIDASGDEDKTARRIYEELCVII